MSTSFFKPEVHSDLACAYKPVFNALKMKRCIALNGALIRRRNLTSRSRGSSHGTALSDLSFAYQTE